MLNGRIIKSSKKAVEGTHKMHAYSDTWNESYDIEYDGELTPDVCNTIVAAFNASPEHCTGSSSYGKLRWDHPDGAILVDVNARQLIVERSTGMCD